MPKVKTNKTLLKKVKLSGSGKLLRSHQLRSGHLRRNKSKQALRRHKVPMVIRGRLEKTLKRMIGK